MAKGRFSRRARGWATAGWHPGPAFMAAQAANRSGLRPAAPYHIASDPPRIAPASLRNRMRTPPQGERREYAFARDRVRLAISQAPLRERHHVSAGHLHEKNGYLTMGKRKLTRQGKPIRYLRSTYLPKEQKSFCLFEAPSAERVKEANEHAKLSLLRIVEVQHIAADDI